ncbi:MAG: DegV family protein [Eubacterium sp.]|nr:DegV family protein [Eubacterium sp.]
MRTAVMTDTNSGVQIKEAEENQIFMLPMPVIMDDQVFFEGKDIDKNQFYGYLESGKNVTTSMPSPGDVLDMWDKILASGYDELVYIPMSSGLSNSCAAANQFADEYDGKVQVVDNHRISVTMYRSIFDAKAMADAGCSAKEIKERLEADAYNSSIYIAVDTLEYLKRGGRVTAAGAAIGAVLNIKPVLTIQGEKLDAFAKVRGMKKAQAKMLDAIEEDLNTRFKDVPADKICIDTATTFINDSDDEEWEHMVQERFPQIKHHENRNLSFSIGCHVGPDAVGIGISVLSK